MLIAVLGGGNGAHTMAADLTMKGYEVNMCEAPEFKESISTTLERQAIELIDAWGEKHTVACTLLSLAGSARGNQGAAGCF